MLPFKAFCLLLMVLLFENPLLAADATAQAWLSPDAGARDPEQDLIWYDATLLPLEGKAWQETKAPYDRLPAKAEGVVRGPVWHLSRHSAGIRLRFATNASRIQVRWTLTQPELAMAHMPATGVSGLDLYGRNEGEPWRFIDNARPTEQANVDSFRMWNTTFDQYLLYLPLYNGVEKLEIGIPTDDRIGPATPANPSLKPIVYYGTSITQGACASRPGMAASAIVGRRLDTPFINLGFSGNGMMDMELADLLAEIDAQVYVLDTFWNMPPDMIEERLEVFVQRLHRLRPETPILLVEDTNYRDSVPTRKGVIIRTIFDKLQAEGMGDVLRFLPSQNMLGTDWEGVVDGTHHNDLGMMRQAEILTEALRQYLGS